LLFSGSEGGSISGKGENTLKRVVVAIDGSEVSRGVIDYALHYAAREKDAELLFLHVVNYVEYEKFTVSGYTVEVPPREEEVKAEFEKFVGEEMKRSKIRKPHNMSIHIARGVPYVEIVSFAEKKDADMIMIGHRGLGDLERFLLGSVASKVVAHAPCSVYVHRLKGSAKKG